MNIAMLYSPEAPYTSGMIRLLDQEAELPEGWLWCDGSAHQSDDYPELVRIIGYSVGGTKPEEFRTPVHQNMSVAGVPSVLHGIIKT